MISSAQKRAWGLLLGSLLAILILTRLPWAGVLKALSTARPGYLVASLSLTALILGLRALRLHIMLASGGPFLRTWRAVITGYACALFLPLGGGEVAKATLLAGGTSTGISGTLGPMAADRLLDLTSLALLLVILLLGHPQDLASLQMRMPHAILAASISGIVLLALVIPPVRRLLLKLGRSWMDLFQRARTDRRFLFTLLGIQAAIFGLELLACALGVRAMAFGPRLDFWALARLNLFAGLSFAIPMVPGALGVHQVATLLALRPNGVSAAEAVALSLLSQCSFAALLAGLTGLTWGLTHREPTPRP